MHHEPWSFDRTVGLDMPSCASSLRSSARADRKSVWRGEQTIFVKHALQVVFTVSMPGGNVGGKGGRREVDVRVDDMEVTVLSVRIFIALVRLLC